RAPGPGQCPGRNVHGCGTTRGRDGRDRFDPAPLSVIRVALADDSALLCEGVARLLTDEGFEVAGQAADADGLVAIVIAERPDVAIIDIRMPPADGGGIEATQRIRVETGGTTAVLVLSQYLEPEVAMRLLPDGARGTGYLLKDRVADVPEFVDAVRRVAAGGSVIDPLIVTRLVERRRTTDPLAPLAG